NCHTLSRPCRVLRTRRASSITRRCLVIAWRVTLEPAVSLAMDIGPSSQRRETSRKRVFSPRAANRDAELFGSTVARELGRVDKVLLDQLHDHAPTLLV